MDRSYISLVGNTTTGKNLGNGAKVFKGKSNGNNLQFRTITATGSSIQIVETATEVFVNYIGGTGGTTYTFTPSGGTQIYQLGNNVTIYSPTGSTGGFTGYTFVESGATQISLVGDVLTIFSPTGTTGGTGYKFIPSGGTLIGLSGNNVTIYSSPPTSLAGYWTSAQTVNYVTGYTSGFTTGNTFVQSGGTIISHVGDIVTIYTPTGTSLSGYWTSAQTVNYVTGYTSGFTTGNTFIQSGGTIISQNGDVVTIYTQPASAITSNYVTIPVFSAYTGTTLIDIQDRLLISTFSGYTGATLITINDITGQTASLEINKVNVSGDTMTGVLKFGIAPTGVTYGQIGKHPNYDALDIQGLAGVALNTPYLANPQWSGFSGAFLTIGQNGLITLTTPPTGATSWQATGGSNSILANVPEDLLLGLIITSDVTTGTLEWNVDFTNSVNQDANVNLKLVVNGVPGSPGIDYKVVKNASARLYGSYPITSTIVSGTTLDIRITSNKNGVVNNSLLRLSKSGSGSGYAQWGSIVGTLSNQTDLQLALDSKLDIVTFSAYTATTGLQQVTEINAVTNIESTFSGGLVTGDIRPAIDSTTAVQINKANGTTNIINVDTISGFTGFGTINPKGVLHVYGSGTTTDINGTEPNSVIIDGPTNVDKDINWSENGVPKWLAETYRDEDSVFWYLYNVEANNSPITIQETGRIGINKQTNIMNYHASQVVGNGLNDIVLSGQYTQNFNTVYEVEIVAITGVTDTWHWRKSIDNGITFGGYYPNSGCTLTPVLLEFGVYVNFENLTGHTVGNIFEFAGYTQIPQGTFTIAPMEIAEVERTLDYTVTPASAITYTDLTGQANGGFSGNQFEIFGVGASATTQAFYWGTTVQINSMYFNLQTFATNIGNQLYAQYWNGTNWIQLGPTHNYIDTTNGLSQSGRLIFSPNTMTGWGRFFLEGKTEAGYDLYWMRIITAIAPSVAPVGTSLSIGNDKRFSVYSAFNDYRPSAYINSLGNMNIGGGNLTGSNKLQVNTANNLQIAVSAGSDSLVEFDNQCSSCANLKIKLASNDACGTILDFSRTRGTLDVPLSLQTGDEIGKINFRGRAATSGGITTQIISQYQGDGSTTRCGDFVFKTTCGNLTAPLVERLRIRYDGNTGFGVSVPTATIHIKSGTTTNAPLKFNSGNLLSVPQAGAVEFRDDRWYGTTTGGTRQCFAFMCDSSSLTLQAVTSYGSSTTIESCFNGGLVTSTIRPTGNTTTAIQINKANGITNVINVDTISGFTGFGTVAPQSKIHIYGTDNTVGDGWNYQSNAVRLDGAFDADKDIQWATEGEPKFTAQIYRCEDGRFWYLSSPQSKTNQITVSNTGRVGINNQTNIMAYHAALLTGGPNDMTVGGLYTQNFTSVYEIEIDSITGATDTYRWRVSNNQGNSFGAWSSSSGCTTGATEIQYGVTVQFDSVTGHALGTSFEFGAFAQLPIGTFVVTPNRINEVQQTLDYTASAITYTDVTAEANSSTFGSYITIFNTGAGATDNVIYFGTLDELNALFINLVVPSVGVTLIAEYYKGNGNWGSINTLSNSFIDGTNNLTTTGGLTWEIGSLTGWIPAYMPNLSGDGYQLFWIRLRTSTSPSVASLANSFARGGNYRIAVLSSPSDFKPSFYVDSMGRTNIGGGDIVGCNQLQVNTANNLSIAPVCGGNSIVEFDGENEDAALLKLKGALNSYCYGTQLDFARTRGTLNTPSSLCCGDMIGSITFKGRVGTSGSLSAAIQAQYTGQIGTTRCADLIFSTACGSCTANATERVRITSSGTTGFGVTAPRARIHVQSGSTTIAPLKFNSGSLLSSPQAGAVEFLTDAWYGTITSGNARKTFAFLEAPQFTGNVNLPSTTCLNSVNLCNFILNSGGTNNACKLNTSIFNYYTGTTAPNSFLKLDQTTPQCVTGGIPRFDAINLNTGYTSSPTSVGTRYWDCANHTTSLVLENGVRLQDGQELQVYGKNTSGSIIRDGQPVSVIQNNGNFTAFGTVNITTPAAYAFVGLATQQIGINQFGYVTTRGVVRDIDTSHLDEGKSVYINITGGTTKTFPSVPNYIVVVGIVEQKSATVGRINVIPAIVPRFADLSDVNGTPLNVTGQIAVWNNSTCYFDFNYNINNYATTSAVNYYTGTTAPNTYYNKSQINAYTGSTQPILSNAVTGATNGLNKPSTRLVGLGGALTQNTVITGSSFDFTLGSKSLTLLDLNGMYLCDVGGQGIHIYSDGCHVDIQGRTSGGVEKTKLTLSETSATFTDSRAIATGLEYAANYDTNYTCRSIPDVEYVNSVATGLNVVASVLVATTGNIVLSGLTTVDGILLTNGNRVLVKNQTTGSTNGIYVATGTTWSRAADFNFNPPGEISNGDLIPVVSGTSNGNTIWVLTTPNPVVSGNSLNFSLFSKTSSVIAGNGICVTSTSGNYNVSVKLPANSGLCADNTGTYINSSIAGVGLCYNAGVMCVDGSALAGNSICWSANTFNVSTTTGTLSTALNSKLNTSCFTLYTGTTAPNTYYNKSQINYYTGTTAPNTYQTIAKVSYYTGTTAPATYKTIALVNYYTGTTAPNTYLTKSAFSTYSGTTVPNNYYSKSQINYYTGTTAPATYKTITSVNYYTGTTAPATYKTIASVNYYTGTTAPATYLTISNFNAYTGTTIPNNYYTKTCINAYTGATQSAINLKANINSPTFTGIPLSTSAATDTCSSQIATTAFVLRQAGTANPLMNGSVLVGTSFRYSRQDHVHPSDTSKLNTSIYSTYTGTTAPSTFANKSAVNYYTGTTAPATYLTISNFNTYTGTTVPNNYYTKTCINAYTGATQTKLNAKAFLSGATFTGVVNVCKPVQNDNTNCAATTSWYISQGATAFPLMDNITCACGTSNLFARQDHVHPSDTSRVIKAGDTMTGALVINSNLTVTGTTILRGATCLGTPATASTVNDRTLFWNPTSCRIGAIQLTGGSDVYLYTDKSTSTSTASATCIPYLSGTPWNFGAGRYQVDFTAQVSNSANGGITLVKFGCDGTVIGNNFCYTGVNAGYRMDASMTRDLTFTAGCHCLTIHYWAGANTACIFNGVIRAKRIC